MTNVLRPDFDQPREDREGFKARRAFLGRQAGAARLGHQIVNRSEAPVRFLSISTSGEPEICVYPDSGKIGAFERLPRGGELYELYRREDQVGYWEGEEPPPLVA